MARYAIGDIQGCYKEFMALLAKMSFNPGKDVLYLVGDLVNRGPDSLNVMKWVYNHQDSVISVLGNHDIYLIARYANLLPMDDEDTLHELLIDKNAPKYIDWLRSCPLIFHDGSFILVHAGIYPCMNFNELLQINNSITIYLRSNDYKLFIKSIFGNKPNAWNQDLSYDKKMKFAVNACTRMRLLKRNDFSMDYKYKGTLNNAPENLIPWFDVPFDKSINKKIIFGHWAALGFFHRHNYVALDTGCAWGRKLTAINLENFEITQVAYGDN